MDASPTTSPDAISRVDSRPFGLAVALCGVSVGANLFALLVLWRRAAGGIERPLPTALLLVTAVAVGLWAWFSRRLGNGLVEARQWSADDDARWLLTTVAWTPSLAIALLTIGLSWPMDRLVDWLVWLPLWVADVFWRQTFLAGAPLAGGDGKEHSFRNRSESDKPIPLVGGAVGQEASEEGLLVQQLSRLRDAQGRESISGMLCAEFAPQQKTSELYVAFCPPFGGIPQVEFEQTDGPPARISLGRALPHGARLDVRLADEASVVSHVHLEVFCTWLMR